MAIKKILITLSAIAALLIILQPASAAGVIYPYTDINDGVLTAGTTLISISNPNQVITLQGSGTDVYFDTSSFTKGIYSTAVNSGSSYYVTPPDASIQILRNGIAGAEIYGKTISSSEFLKIIVTPTNIDYLPYALSIKTDAGGVTTYFGNVDTKVGTPTGLRVEGSTLVMTTPVLKDAGITSGSFDIAALYDRNDFRSGIPEDFLTGTYYTEQHANTQTAAPTKTPTPAPTKTTVTVTKTPTPTKTVTAAPTETKTAEPTVPSPEPTQTTSPIFPAVIVTGLIAAAAILRRR